MVPVTIYTRNSCPYCVQAKQLLDKKGARYTELNYSITPTVRDEMVKRSGRNTFPQIFIGNVHAGGCDDIHALDAKGKLDSLLKTGMPG
jgi:glutaredoxin 3